MRNIGVGRTALLGGLGLALLALGCNSFDAAPSDQSGTRLVIPVDEREVTTSAVTPPSISGGTLTILRDGSAAIVSDPERDRISIVDLATMGVRATVPLQAGDEPGRSVEDGGQRVHVALRRGGGVATIDARTGLLIERRAVCKSPRGLAFDAASQLVHVACAEGKLVSLPANGGAAVRSLALPNDLRDVVVQGGELWVSRFKSAELLRVDAQGALSARASIPRRLGMLNKIVKSGDVESFEQMSVNVDAGVAWRTVVSPAGGAVIIHQQEVVDDIPISKPSANGSAYGGGAGGFDCSGIVKNAVTVVGASGAMTTTTLAGAPLPVDVAVSADRRWLAVAHAGTADMGAPRPFVEFAGDGGVSGSAIGPARIGGGAISVMPVDFFANNTVSDNSCSFPTAAPFVNEQVTAVAFAPNGTLLAQTREPPTLIVIPDVQLGSSVSISLPGEARADTGHDIFHRDAGGGIACASCHPEGSEDGKTWRFVGTGERRTQPLNVGLRDTAPFHWNGDLENMGELMSEVFVGRMGGVRESAPRLSSLSEWLFALPAPPALHDADAASARGKELFDSAEVGCATCHSGSKLTNNQSVAIDNSAKTKLQVPSLVAIGYRAPFMHTGCAATLADRFDPACGGDAHGNTAQLTQPQLDDLIAYLESL
jgi:mono/diheme cytochrome c family protein